MDTSADTGTGGLGQAPNPSLGPVRGRAITPGQRETGEFTAWVGAGGNLCSPGAVRFLSPPRTLEGDVLFRRVKMKHRVLKDYEMAA